MKKHQMRLGAVAFALCLLSFISAGEVYAATLDEVLGVRSSTTVDGKQSQAKSIRLRAGRVWPRYRSIE